MRIGLNVNTLTGNRDIPNDYLLHLGTSWLFIVQLMQHIKRHIDPSRIRTLLWMAERDLVYTPWLHIPLTEAEIYRIQAYAWLCKNNGVPLSLSFGPLWEAEFLKGDFYPNTGPIPDNPFSSPAELAAAMKDSLWRLLFTEKLLPPGTVIDLHNEFDLASCGPEHRHCETMELFYPWARDAIKRAGLISTASTIIDTDGTGKRAIATYKWLAELGYGMPDHLEVHVNSVPDEALRLNAASWKAQLMDAYGLDIVIGEDDQPRNDPRACAEWIQIVAPKEVIRWIDYERK